jgi:glycosyltransferase involved in cell wall biosynthesis
MITGQLPTPEKPGSMAFIARQIESLRNIGLEVDVLQITGRKKIKYLQAISRLRPLLKSTDLIHAHFGYCGWVGRSQFQKPVVISFMGDDLLGTPSANGELSLLNRLMIRTNCRFAESVDSVIVKSEEMARVIDPIESHVVPNGVDLENFYPMDITRAREALGWDKETYYVLFPGFPELPRKGYPLAKAVVDRAAQKLSRPVELAVLWGVSPESVPLYLNACQALLMTSLWEGSPNVVKEAMACNMPIVSVPVGDVPELLGKVPGCIVCERDEEELADALVGVLRNGERGGGRKALQDRGLDLESVALKIRKIYEHVLNKDRKG